MSWIDRLKKLAKNRGVTIKDLAAKIDMSEANLYKNFKRESIETRNLERIAEVLNVPVSYFFTQEDDGEKEILNINNSNSNNELELCKKEIEYLKERLKDKEEIIELLKRKK